jgi:hypothetical protein
MTKIQRFASCISVALLLSIAQGQGQGHGSQAGTETSVNRNGNSSLETKINATAVRIVIATYQIDIGKPGEPPEERKNNCTYSSFPCSQVSNLQIWVKGTNLFVPKSVFADCTDVGNMRLTKEAGGYVLTISGGDASEAYSVKVFFTADRVTRREVYDGESNSLLESTIYKPSPVLN